MTFTQLLQRPNNLAMSSSESVSSDGSEKPTTLAPTLSLSPGLARSRPISLDALRLVELTDRTSAVLRSQAAESLAAQDPVLSIFRTFARLNRFRESSSLSVVSHDEYVTNIADHAREHGSQMVIIPWTSSGALTIAEDGSPAPGPSANAPYNPFDTLFNRQASDLGSQTQGTSSYYTAFVRKVFASCPTDVALFVDRGLSFSGDADVVPHVFLPFFGGPDDRLALNFLVQLCASESLRATVVRFRKTEADETSSVVSNLKKTDIHAAHFGNVSPGFTVILSLELHD